MTNSRIRISTLITLLVLSLLTPIKSKSETTGSDFINITYLNGLTTNSIYDICTDKSGCLWIGTATGLSKYNGYNVQNFFKEEMYIRSNIIKYLMCDKRNRIWIGSGSGVGLYDNDTKKFLNLDLMTGDAVENKVAGLFEDSRGTIWVSLRSGAITAINPDTFSTSKHFTDAENENYFSRIWFEPENNLYLATKINGGLFYLDMTDDSEIAFSPAENPAHQESRSPSKGFHLQGDGQEAFLQHSLPEQGILDPLSRGTSLCSHILPTPDLSPKQSHLNNPGESPSFLLRLFQAHNPPHARL